MVNDYKVSEGYNIDVALSGLQFSSKYLNLFSGGSFYGLMRPKNADTKNKVIDVGFDRTGKVSQGMQAFGLGSTVGDLFGRDQGLLGKMEIDLEGMFPDDFRTVNNTGVEEYEAYKDYELSGNSMMSKEYIGKMDRMIHKLQKQIGNLSEYFNGSIDEALKIRRSKHTIEYFMNRELMTDHPYGFRDYLYDGSKTGDDAMKGIPGGYAFQDEGKYGQLGPKYILGGSGFNKFVGRNLFSIAGAKEDISTQPPDMRGYANLRDAISDNNDLNIGTNYYWFCYITIPKSRRIMKKLKSFFTGGLKARLPNGKIVNTDDNTVSLEGGGVWDEWQKDYSLTNGIVPSLPYNGFFPVLSFSISTANFQYVSIPLANGGAMSVPDGSAPVTELTLQVLDNDDMDVTQWLLNYQANIYSDRMSSTRDNSNTFFGDYVGDFDTDWRIRSARESYINVNIFWMNSGWRIIRHKQYACIPNFNSVSYDGADEKSPRIIPLTMNIIGTFWPDTFESYINDFKGTSDNASNNINAGSGNNTTMNPMYQHILG